MEDDDVRLVRRRPRWVSIAAFIVVIALLVPIVVGTISVLWSALSG